MAVVAVSHLAKTYPGQEVSLRGTKLEWRGPALWARNLVRAVHLTANAAPPVPALRDVSLTIAPGEVFGLVGRNGSGKTTLIKILAGLIRPSAGSGTVAGMGLDAPQAIRAAVSYVSTSGWMGWNGRSRQKRTSAFLPPCAGYRIAWPVPARKPLYARWTYGPTGASTRHSSLTGCASA